MESGVAYRCLGRTCGWRATEEKDGSGLCLCKRDPPSEVSPRVIEAEDGFGELPLLQHVLHQSVVTADANARVSHAQNPIEVQVVKGSAGLIQAQAKLLVPDDDVLDLEEEERCWEMSAFGTSPLTATSHQGVFGERLGWPGRSRRHICTERC